RFQELVTERLAEWNVPEEARPQPANLVGRTWAIQSATPRGLVHGQKINTNCGELEVLHTPGHTNGSICLKFGRQLFSGDHVLPTITPNVGGGDLRQRGLLGRFLESLDHTLALAPDIDQVFPGHGVPFNHLAERCQELIQHHQDRLKQTEACLQQGRLSVYEMAICLFGELHDYHVILGCAEAQAHLEFLVTAGRACYQHGQYTLQSA
ncbi:MAG TPA: hypothetical protein DCE55_20515, partial [Planctomycetaceae bacterium]|nr:hypothetical protein [Planctomycetaceae bacterium]